MFSKLKQFKELRDSAKQLENALAQKQVVGSAQTDKIKITMNGNQEVLQIEISEELLSIEQKETLNQGIKDALNDALGKTKRIMAEQMKEMGGLSGLGMPGL